MVAELVPGTAPFTVLRATVGVLDGKIFFSACEGTHGCEPWIFDFDQCPADTAAVPTRPSPGERCISFSY